MNKQWALYFDNLLNRDKYLSGLNRRVEYFKDRPSSASTRTIDALPDVIAAPDFTVPEVNARDFCIEALQQSIRSRGCLIVRDFFTVDEVDEMRAYVEHSFAVNREGRLNRYLTKQVDMSGVLKQTREDIQRKRQQIPTYTDTVRLGKKFPKPYIGDSKSFLTAQTPIVCERMLGLFERKRLKDVLAQYFENGPCVSIYKWALRKSAPPQQPIDFHQDGTFMGEEIDSLNCWIPVSDCGAGYDVHGLDVVPVRLKRLFGAGTGVLGWTISEQAVVDEFGRDAIVSPTFRQGDAFFFDHLLVHRTQSIPGFSQQRYAIETWFFDAVNFPQNQIPVRW
ncbi:MAG: hypothetical protein R3E50_17645 [Halioglobus sp.]